MVRLYQPIFKYIDVPFNVMPMLQSFGPIKTHRERMAELGTYTWAWCNDHTCSGSEEVITSGCAYNIPSGKTMYVSSLGILVLTTNKSAAFEIVKCSAIDGGGTPAAISPKWVLSRGVAITELVPRRIVLHTPIKVVYDQAKSISFRVNGADNSTHIMAEFKGWYE